MMHARSMRSRPDPAPAPVVERRRGRPRRYPGGETVVSVRIPNGVYDQYDQTAKRARESLHWVLRHVLIAHAPRQ